MAIRSVPLSVLGVAVLSGVLGCSDSSPTQPTDPYPNGPTITCPAAPPPIIVANVQGATVQYGTPTSVGGAPAVALSCAPPSGAFYPIGTTRVTCTAIDARQRTDTCSFNIVVQTTPRISMTQFVAFGDSITWGEDGDPQVLCGSNNNVSPYDERIRPRQQVPPSNRYPEDLQGKLQARYAVQPGITVDNRGNPGEPAGEPTTLTRFQQVLGSKRYDAVLLMEGTNDIFYGNDLTKLDTAITGTDGRSGLNGMINAAKSRSVRAFLATIPPMVPGGSRACGNKLVVPLNDRIRALASAQGVTLVDVYAGMGSAFQQYIGPDGLHPNVAGYDNIATTFFNVLRGALEVASLSTTSLPGAMPFAAPQPVLPRSRPRPPQ